MKQVNLLDSNDNIVATAYVSGTFIPDTIEIGGHVLTTEASDDEWCDENGDLWLGGATKDDNVYEIFPRTDQ